MDEKFLKSARAKLLSEKKRLEKELKKARTFPEYGSSEDDSTLEVEDYEEGISLEKKLRNLLKDVDKALLKIEKKTYGICENCKNHIEQGRLKIYPAASLCSSCASKRK